MTLLLQTCAACGAVQYPRRAVCRTCLSDRLEDRPQPAGATLLARAAICVSFNEDWASRLPVAAGTVLLDAGVQAIVLLEADPAAGARTTVRWQRDGEEPARLIATTMEEGA